MTELKLPIDISVVIPVHNVEEYLDECLNSLHCQSLRTAEFIVINDGSSDHCAEICNKYARLDKRFVVVHQECQGTLMARKRAFALARGTWCICVDGDDYLPFNTVLEMEVNLANKYDVDILRFDMSAFSEDENAIKIYSNFSKEWVGSIESPFKIIQEIYTRGEHTHGAVGWGMADKIYRTSVVQKAIQDLQEVALICGTDAYQFFLICFYSNTFKSVKTEPLYSYRLGTGISNGKVNIEKFASQAQILNIPKFLKSFVKTHGTQDEYDPIIKSVTARLIDHTICRFHKLSVEDSFKAFDYLFCNPEIQQNVLLALENFYSKQPALLALKASKSRLLQAYKRKIKKIGIFYPKFHNEEDQQIVLMQASLFQTHGFEIIFFTEDVTDIDYCVTRSFPIAVLPRRGELKRIEAFEEAIIQNNVDLLIYHAASSPETLFDLLTVKLTGRFFVIYLHENATRLLTQKYLFYKQLISTYRLADSLVVSTSMEQFYYRSHGVKAVNISNSLRTFDETKGYISVPRHNVKGAAKVVCELLRNDERRNQFALEERSSINNFKASNPSHIDGWLDLIHSLENGQLNQPLPVNRDFINFVDSTISYCQEGINRHREEILRYQNLSKQYQEENNRLQSKIKSYQEEIKSSREKIWQHQKENRLIQDELLYHLERIDQLNLLSKSEYDKRMIERYTTCRDFVVRLCPLGTTRYFVVKKVAKVIYRLIKRYSGAEMNQSLLRGGG